MKNIFKLILLFVIFVIPVLIFLFLKYYGKNEFSVPEYYSNGLPSDTLDCTYPAGPYHVELSGLANSQDNLILLDARPGELSLTRLKNLITRLHTNTDSGSYKFITYSTRLNNELPEFENIGFHRIAVADLPAVKCALVTGADNQLILVDQQGVIRGYYGTDREELDRLLVEMEILGQNEQ